MAERITIEALEAYLWHSAVLLRTNIDAGSYKQYIFPLLFFKRICDVYDEEVAADVAKYGRDAELYADEHTFTVPKGHHWHDVRQVTEDVGTAIVAAFREIEKANGDKLTGIFGDGAWTNKNRLPDRLLKDLLEHFSTVTLSLANCPEDELGQGYEYLIKKFADDSGHTAQEFYTNRTVVHLMTEMLRPQSMESIYDPTCGSAGMLISCIAWLKEHGQEYRNVKVYGQEINSLTSAIGRMNLFLHGVEDFHIVNGDTLRNPAFVEGGRLKQFDLVLANPPYSIKQWDRAAFENDKYGRNKYGTPPQSRADYAFIQHIVASLNPQSGRCAVLLPHGVLNRKEEAEIRKGLVRSDCIDAVIGLGRHLFYNSGLESCILVCRMQKPAHRKGNILFVEAEKCLHKEKTQNYLFPEDIAQIMQAYTSTEDIPGFSRMVPMEEVLENDGNLNIKLYVHSGDAVADDDTDPVEYLDSYLGDIAGMHEAIAGLDEKYAIFQPQSYSTTGAESDTSTWQTVKLQDIAEEYSERIDNPSASNYEWYIGSDCIDGFDYRIERRTPASKVESAQKLFKKGDYLLVRRSLYGSDFRERAPRADFDGVCSADILTIREKPGKVADGFLIAVLYSKPLWDFIVANSTSSLTRRIKWSQLKDFEFKIPPLYDQRRLAELLWAMERTKKSYRQLLTKTDALVKSEFLEVIRPLIQSGHVMPLGELIESNRPITYGILKPGSNVDGGIPVVKVKDFPYGFIDQTDLLHTSTEIDACYQRSKLQTGDLLISIRGSVGRMAEVPESLAKANITQDTARLSIRREYNRQYVRGVLESDPLQIEMQKNVRGVAIKGINIGFLRLLKIPIAEEKVQKALADLDTQSRKCKYPKPQDTSAHQNSNLHLSVSIFRRIKASCKSMGGIYIPMFCNS